MKTNVEIRGEAREILSKGWFGRIFIALALLYALVFLVMGIIFRVLREREIHTWSDFLGAKLENLIRGLDYAVPSAAAAMEMSGATLFEQFFSYLFGAIVAFGIVRVSLKAVRGEAEGWFSSAFGGFARPFGVMWLLVRTNIQVFLWSLLFVIPGIVAIYRYRLAWYMKSDNPDWSAGKCLAESGKMMRGLKWQAFCLDFFYMVHVFLIAFFLSAGLGVTRAFGGIGGLVAAAVVLVVVAVAMLWLIRLVCSIFVARAEFYRAVLHNGEMSVGGGCQAD